MRKLSICFLAVLFAACNSGDDTKVNSASTTDSSDRNVTYAYTPTYSSDFEIGSTKNSSAVLDIWKSWDNGDLSKTRDLFADSVEMHLSNGMIIKGLKDSVMSSAQKFRDMYSNVTSTVSSVLPTRSRNKNEDWVGVWGKEVSTDKTGKTDSFYLQETWRFNKDGKVNFMLQYARSATPPKQ